MYIEFENLAVLVFYAASSCSFLSTFRNYTEYIKSVLGLQAFFYSWTLRMGPIGCPETSGRKCHYILRNNPEGFSFQLLRSGSL